MSAKLPIQSQPQQTFRSKSLIDFPAVKRRIALQKVRKRLKFQPVTWSEFCQRASCHGVADYYFARSRIAKFWWLTVLLLALGVLGFYAYQTVNGYFNNPVITTVSYVPADSLKFPQIYICPLNPIDYQKVTPKIINEEYFRYFDFAANISDILGSKPRIWERIAPHLTPEIVFPNFTFITPKLKQTFQDFFMNLGYRTRDLFKQCAFESQPVDCTKIVFPVIDKDYAKCFIIDTKKYQKVAGQGLSLLLDVHTEKYHPTEPTPFDGVFIRVSEKIDPTSFVQTLVQPGNYYKIPISARFLGLKSVNTERMRQPCYHIGEYNMKIMNYSYTTDGCRFDCAQRIILQECNCLLAFDRSFFSRHISSRLPICTANEVQKCASDVIENRNRSEIHACTSNCYPPCVSWEYSTSVSSAKFPSNALLKSYKKTNSPNEMNFLSRPLNEWAENYILLDIAFDRMEYTKVEQEWSLTTAMMISDLGGLFGLWVGGSLFSVIQLVTFLLGLMWGKWTKKFKASRLPKDLSSSRMDNVAARELFFQRNT